MTMRQAAVPSMCDIRVLFFLEVGPKGQILETRYSFLASVRRYTSPVSAGFGGLFASSSSASSSSSLSLVSLPESLPLLPLLLFSFFSFFLGDLDLEDFLISASESLYHCEM